MEEIEHCDDLQQVVNDLGWMKGDDIAGFLFGFPDISDGIRRANGRIWPFGWIHLLRDMKQVVNDLGWMKGDDIARSTDVVGHLIRYCGRMTRR